VQDTPSGVLALAHAVIRLANYQEQGGWSIENHSRLGTDRSSYYEMSDIIDNREQVFGRASTMLGKCKNRKIVNTGSERKI